MNIGLLKGVIQSLNWAINDLESVLNKENINLNYENEKRLDNTMTNLYVTRGILLCQVEECESKKLK